MRIIYSDDDLGFDIVEQKNVFFQEKVIERKR